MLSYVFKTDHTQRLVNPLAGLTKSDLMLQVDSFAAEKDLVDIAPLLRKGAIVAQAATPLVEMEELDREELLIFELETQHRWKHPFALYATVFVCSIGAAVQYGSLNLPATTTADTARGWDQTGSNGANLTFPVEFGIASGSSRDYWLLGLVNAAPYISSALLYVCLVASTCTT